MRRPEKNFTHVQMDLHEVHAQSDRYWPVKSLITSEQVFSSKIKSTYLKSESWWRSGAYKTFSTKTVKMPQNKLVRGRKRKTTALYQPLPWQPTDVINRLSAESEGREKRGRAKRESEGRDREKRERGDLKQIFGLKSLVFVTTFG